MFPTIPGLISPTAESLPVAQPVSDALKTDPFKPSRIWSLKCATLFSLEIFVWLARKSFARVPISQPSPITIIVGSITLSAAVTSLIVLISIRPIKSKRNPSRLYSLAQYLTESTINLRTIGRSVATSLPQPLPLVRAPLSSVRKK